MIPVPEVALFHRSFFWYSVCMKKLLLIVAVFLIILTGVYAYKLNTLRYDVVLPIKSVVSGQKSASTTLAIKTWEWVRTTYNNDTEVSPRIAKKFALTFMDGNRFSAKTDCNTVGGEYTVSGNKIVFGKMFSTKMYCEGAQEEVFTKMLEGVAGYQLTSNKELVFDLKLDTGSMIFK